MQLLPARRGCVHSVTSSEPGPSHRHCAMHTTAAALLGLLVVTMRNARSRPDQPPDRLSAVLAPEPGRRQEPGHEPPRVPDRKMDLPALSHGPSEQAQNTVAEARSPVPRQLQQGAVDANGEPDCGDNAAFAALSAQVMHSCCPSPAPGAEEEAGSGECELPANCDSTECADEFLEFFDACYAQLSALSAAVFGRFDTFNTGCEARTRPHHHRTHPLAPYAERGVDILPAAARTPPRCHRSLPPRAHANVFPLDRVLPALCLICVSPATGFCRCLPAVSESMTRRF